MAKAKRRNAYFYFMLEYKRREEAKGIVFPKGFQDVACFASDEWKNLPESVRNRYKKMAEDYNKSEERERGLLGTDKKKPKSVLPVKCITTKEAKMIAEKEYIKNLLESLNTEQLLDQLFYLCHVNVFCKTDDNEYFPAEIALSKFTLRDGPLKVFHRFLNAGEIPMGYSYEVKRHSEGTHRIPLDLIKANRGYLGVYQSILNFLKESNPNEIPPLYTMFDEPFHNCSMSAVKHSLKRIWETQNVDIEEDGELEDDDSYENVFKIYSLPILFFHLKEKCAKLFDDGVAFPNTSLANLELLKDRYSFDTEIACTFHQDNDNVQYCSQSYTVRWARVVREQCCKFLEDEEEEEAEEVTPAVVQLKDEKLDLPVKKEIPTIKTEKDVKKELDGIKTEKDDVLVKTERHGDSVRIKTEKDREYDDRRVKTEKDRGYDRSRSHRDDEVRVKTEKDRGYSDERKRSSRDRDRSGDRSGSHQDDVRVKSERDHNRSSRDRDGDDRRRYWDDDRIKRERDRGYDDERRSRERDRYDDRRRHRRSSRDDDVRVKNEKYGGYDDRRHREDAAKIKTEKNNHYDNRPTPQRDQIQVIELDEPVRVKTEKPDYDFILKSEHIDIPFTPLKDERILNNTDPHFSGPTARVEREPQHSVTIEPVRVKIEKPDYDYILKTEHVDIPYTPKDEYPFSNARDPRSSGPTTQTRDPRSSGLNTQSRDPRLQNQTSRDPRVRSQASTSQATVNDFPISIVIKPESTDQSRSQDFPITIPIKRERSNEFPLPIPIKTERTTKPTSAENSGFPMPIPIKIEKFDQNRPNDFLIPIPTKVEQLERSNQNRQNDFPMPIPIKVEKPERSSQNRQNDFPVPVTIKSEKFPEVQATQRHDFPMPKPIKIERTAQPQSVTYRNEFPLPISIKEEYESPSQLKTERSDTNKRKIISTGSDTMKRLRPGGNREEKVVKNEPVDYDDCPLTPRREDFPDCNREETVVKSEPPDYDDCPPTPRREDFPGANREKTVVKNEPVNYDDCPPTPCREDFPELIQIPEQSRVRIKTETSVTYEIKHEAVHLDDEGNICEVKRERFISQWEPMDCDPCEVPKNQTGTGARIHRKSARKESTPVETKKEEVVKDEIFTSYEDID